LERIARILQGTETNYETDLFWPIICALEKLAGCCYRDPEKKVPFRIVSDHIRAIVFLLDEQLRPANEGRGYVLRNIIRRAAVAGIELNLAEPFLYRLVPVVANQLEEVYPTLKERQKDIEVALRDEEEKFHLSSEAASRKFREFLKREEISGGRLSGEVAFKLYGTLGIRREMLSRLAENEGLTIDWPGFEYCLEEEKKRSRASSSFQENREVVVAPEKVSETKFLGYETLTCSSRLLAVYKERGSELLDLVLEATPFYPEKGGQVGDQGFVSGRGVVFQVVDTQIDEKGVIYHRGQLKEGTVADLSPGMELTARVDENRRKAIAANHTATHLLHFVLRSQYGKETRQAGSYVGPDRLRFDFFCNTDIPSEKLREIEQLVQEKIFEDTRLTVKEVPLAEAIREGCLAVWGGGADCSDWRVSCRGLWRYPRGNNWADWSFQNYQLRQCWQKSKENRSHYQVGRH
ncbi:MAG: alanine--tRNA ligase-related protein, partial [Candidatus Omnitrophica bacterium]|nr:alanine--tRNA ligase-related protein [Candidatus Omnitrophota bacterium]